MTIVNCKVSSCVIAVGTVCQSSRGRLLQEFPKMIVGTGTKIIAKQHNVGHFV